MRSITLQHATDFAGFRTFARELLTTQVPPEEVSWRTLQDSGDLFGSTSDAPAQIGNHASATPAFTVPRSYLELASTVALHSDAGRFALLYRLLWRLRSEPRLLSLSIDADVARARGMEKAVDRDIHKMHAFVRFREAPGMSQQTMIAWFEPAHHIVEAAAPFFVRRFPNFQWAILTPRCSAYWDTRELTFGPGRARDDAPAADAAEALWRSYYASIFNPARLKVTAMRAHMPKKYWGNLPESVLIPELIAASQGRTAEMIAKPATEPAKRRRAVPPNRVVPARTRTKSIATLREQAEHCRDCPLWQNATQTVFGEGPQSARIVFVGEQPGDQEDLAGKPFVGPAGRLLDRALADAGVDRKTTYVTNAVKHFKFEPRGKRRLHKTPAQMEVAACHQWLERELDAIRPELVVAMGATAARAVFGRVTQIQKNRGKIIPAQNAVSDHQADILVTVHPSFLLRVPPEDKEAAYAEFVRDLKLAAKYSR